jgi:hypothetical protein
MYFIISAATLKWPLCHCAAKQFIHSFQMRHSAYICNICGKASSTKCNLKQHMRRHEGKYTYACQVCHKGFSSSGMLRGHMSWHTGIREFQCNMCNKEFRYPQVLKRHMTEKHTIPASTWFVGYFLQWIVMCSPCTVMSVFITLIHTGDG